jgi:hypothetical protein
VKSVLAWWRLNANGNFPKVGSIGGVAKGSVSFDTHLMARSDTLSGGFAMPIAVFFVLRFVEAIELPDSVIHRIASILLCPG